MATMSESKKRDFITRMLELLKENKQLLTEKGFNSDSRVEELSGQYETAQAAETSQQQAERAAKEATKVSQQALKSAYNNASASVDLLVGLLGKDHQLSKQLRKLRN